MSAGAVLVAVLSALAVAGCADDAGVPASIRCADEVPPPAAVPAPERGRMAAAGITEVVGGGGGPWLVAPAVDRWGEVFERRGDGHRAKLALWVADAEEPAVVVTRVGGGGRGTASTAPTAAGLPGPLPTTIDVPGAGCWQVTAVGRQGAVTVWARVG